MYIRVEDIPEETLELLDLDGDIDYMNIKDLLKRIDKVFVSFEHQVDKLQDKVYELTRDDSDILYEMSVGK